MATRKNTKKRVNKKVFTYKKQIPKITPKDLQSRYEPIAKDGRGYQKKNLVYVGKMKTKKNHYIYKVAKKYTIKKRPHRTFKATLFNA